MHDQAQCYKNLVTYCLLIRMLIMAIPYRRLDEKNLYTTMAL